MQEEEMVVVRGKRHAPSPAKIPAQITKRANDSGRSSRTVGPDRGGVGRSVSESGLRAIAKSREQRAKILPDFTCIDARIGNLAVE